ncbi:MAG: polyribonucleotide nucleotidyltransferase [Flavobacteriales bacterium]|nr:polyribonucleotide nucleotidyltransferase [Flavobacteriales bacterium]
MQLGFSKTIDMGDGNIITIESGKLAKQADGSVVVRQGNTMLLATICSAKDAKDGVDFMPLTVEYKEKFSARGIFPGGFFKRETRPSDYEILISRLIDRALRPLFPDDYHADTQVAVFLISADEESLPDQLACLAASAAIAVSDVPFNGPVSEVRVARIDGKLVINPSKSALENADLDMIVAGSEKDIVMVEGEMSEVSEELMIEAIMLAHESIKKHCAVQKELAALSAKGGKVREYSHEDNDEELRKQVWSATYDKAYAVAKAGGNKDERGAAFKQIEADFLATLPEEVRSEKAGLVGKYYHDVEKEAMRRMIIDEGIRLDGRNTTQIRPIWCEVDYLPGAHGSSIFTRGETQSLTSVTLGGNQDEQEIDGVIYKGTEKFLLHYNFPPFSTGEARPMRATSRREVGHGNLALRGLKPVIPTGMENPYTVRVVSDILESNGSSSMATVCAGTLALMDAGIKIKRPVSGIAMGLITDKKTGKYAILSDILGDEDHLGDMDFKVVGTVNGITACQMDIKVDGLSHEILKNALEQARQGRLHILGEMLKTMDAPRAETKPHAPRIEYLEVPQDVIGAIIGPGGKIIQEIQRTTGTTISISEKDGKGVVEILSPGKDGMDAALSWVKRIAFPPTVEIGETYKGKVRSIMPYGAFVEIVPGVDGLLHVSELEWKRIEKVEEVIKEGEIVEFKVLGKDPKNGKFKLSRKVLLPKPEGYVEKEERKPREHREKKEESTSNNN